ncbi:DUF4221 family protein [Parabacteroides timonensis]|uniref:DUF4221 family protein n=1 Tax=Parabacteroides timonensis TaxID=1871013 RepID=UPI00094E9017|nr:DUF4221 family protein [Parabacteroides timonensis]
MKTKYFLPFLLLLLLSCSGKLKNIDYTLVPTGKKLVFNLDTKTYPFMMCVSPYTDTDQKEYLTLQCHDSNTIHFYDIHSGKHLFEIKTDREGPNGVGNLSGYYIHNLDSIYLSGYYGEELILIDRKAEIKKRIPIKNSQEGIPLDMRSFTQEGEVRLQSDSLYIIAEADRWIEHDPIAAVLNIQTGIIHTYPPEYITFPNQNKQKKYGWESYMQRCFNGTNFVYSFHFLEDLLVASPSQDEMTRVPAKSRYIEQVRLLDDYGNLTFQDATENPNYGGILYDPYREVYYRIAYPATEIGRKLKDREAMELLQFGRKNFTIMILDKQFRLLGETRMPDYTYNSNLLFVRPDGLYISSSHPFNENYNDDELCFQLFELKTRGNSPNI